MNAKKQKKITNTAPREKRRDRIRILQATARAAAKNWFAGAVFVCIISLIISGFSVFLNATHVHQPNEISGTITDNSAKYLSDRINDLAESQKWVLLIFGGLAALITVLGATFQWLQYTEVRREREVKEPDQQTMLREVNTVIETVGKTLKFRLREEEEVKEIEKKIVALQSAFSLIRAEAEETFNELNSQLNIIIKWPRITFTTLDSTQEATLNTFIGRFSALPGWFRKEKEKDLKMGQITYFAGVIAFIHNDIIRAMSLLNQAKNCRDANANSQDEQLKYWGAFVTYWMGLIHKSWGKLEESRLLFDDSLQKYGPKGVKKEKEEYLSRISFAEVLMFEKQSRGKAKEFVSEVLTEIGDVTKIENTETKKMWIRAKLLAGNGEMADDNFIEAEKHFSEIFSRFPQNYYSLFSIAQCQRKLNDTVKSEQSYTKTINLIQESGDLGAKKELGPLCGLYYVAMRAAVGYNNISLAESYRRQLYDLLDPRRASFNGFQLRIFVPDKVQMMLAEELRRTLVKI